MFKSTKTLALGGLLIAIATVLSFFTVPISSVLEIRFSTIAIAVAGFLLGPVGGAIVGGSADIIGYFIHPTGPYFPGFTISNILSGIVFGLFFYNRKPVVWRVLVANIIQALLICLLLNTLWISILYGKGYIPLLAARTVKELVMVPVNTAIYMAIFIPIYKIWMSSGFNDVNPKKSQKQEVPVDALTQKPADAGPKADSTVAADSPQADIPASEAVSKADTSASDDGSNGF